jgi:DNA-binding transcriptional ArsR family regulator
MLTISSFAETAALVGDPARAAMLAALMDGRALTAGELARVAGVAPQTASGHLARLTEAGLLGMERQGRHRYHRLASAAVAAMIESIMAVSAEAASQRGGARRLPVTGPRNRALRRIRTCYDHLAGEVAVAIADRLVESGHVELAPDGGALTESGTAFLAGLGVDLAAAAGRVARRGGPLFCRPCLDWSERRPHIAGAVGAAFCTACFGQGWVRRMADTRAVEITPAGQLALGRAFGI